MTVEGRPAGSTMTLVAWRVLWALLFAAAVLSTACSKLIPIYEWWGDGPDAIDRDMLFIVRFTLQVAYIPTIISCALPVRSRTMRILSVILGIAIAVFLVRLPE